MDVIREIVALLARRNDEPLPDGAEEWLVRHPRQAERLLRDVRGLRGNEYLVYEYAVSGRAWGASADLAGERLQDALGYSYPPPLRWRWTGRWMTHSIPLDEWLANGGGEEE